jgi:hypothetical protein
MVEILCRYNMHTGKHKKERRRKGRVVRRAGILYFFVIKLYIKNLSLIHGQHEGSGWYSFY